MKEILSALEANLIMLVKRIQSIEIEATDNEVVEKLKQAQSKINELENLIVEIEAEIEF